MLNPSAQDLKRLTGPKGSEELRYYGLELIVYVKNVEAPDGAVVAGIFTCDGKMIDAHGTIETARLAARMNNLETCLVH